MIDALADAVGDTVLGKLEVERGGTLSQSLRARVAVGYNRQAAVHTLQVVDAPELLPQLELGQHNKPARLPRFDLALLVSDLVPDWLL